MDFESVSKEKKTSLPPKARNDVHDRLYKAPTVSYQKKMAYGGDGEAQGNTIFIV